MSAVKRRFYWLGVVGALVLAAPMAALGAAGGSFLIDWTDRVGNTHPLLGTQVTLYDSNNGVETPIGTWVTDSIGKLTFSTSYTRPGGGPLQLVLDVKSVVSQVGTAGVNFNSAPFALRLPGTYTFANNTFQTSYTTPAVTNTSDAGKAIGFMQGLKVARDHFAGLGASTPYAQVRFGSQWGNASFMQGQSMNLGYDSWGGWDVAFHEYAHGVADLSNLDADPHVGAAHAFNQDNVSAGPALGRFTGTTFAWQEGIATYMGTSALRNRLAVAISNMPPSDYNESYDRYSSTGTQTQDSSALFSVHLENRTGVVDGTNFLIPGKGEGDELSIARVLWDLEDNTPGEALPRGGRTDQVALGAQGVYNLMKTAATAGDARLSGLWRAARQAHGGTALARSLLGDVFEANAVSAIPGAAGGVPDGGSTTSTTPVLAWTTQNFGHSSRFLVAVYDEDWSTLLALSPQIDNSTSWQLASPLEEGTYNWVVISNSVVQDFVSFDDSFWSGGASFSIVAPVVPEPGTAGAMVVMMLVPALTRRRGRGGNG